MNNDVHAGVDIKEEVISLHVNNKWQKERTFLSLHCGT